jgi:hypothetical protein
MPRQTTTNRPTFQWWERSKYTTPKNLPNTTRIHMQNTNTSTKAHEPHSRDRTHTPATSKWPVPVNPKLKPSCTPEAVGRVKNGKYVMTPEERKAFDERDRTKKSAVASLKQDDFATALRLFSAGYEQVVTPASVLADSGASLGLCISSRIAEKIGLTWTPGSAPLVGVGGTSHSESKG